MAKVGGVHGEGVCLVKGECVARGDEGHAWQRRMYMVKGGICGEGGVHVRGRAWQGGHACQRGACVSKGACVAKEGACVVKGWHARLER